MTATKTRPPKTVADLLALPEEARAELIEGEILMSPSPSPRHQRIAVRLTARLETFVSERQLGQVFAAPLDVFLPGPAVVQPALIFVASRNLGIVGARIEGVPDLLIEIVSPSNPERDRLVKRDLYQRAGVPEYWIVDGDEQAIEVLRLVAGEYEPAGYFTASDTLISPTLPGLALTIRPLLA